MKFARALPLGQIMRFTTSVRRLTKDEFCVGGNAERFAKHRQLAARSTWKAAPDSPLRFAVRVAHLRAALPTCGMQGRIQHGITQTKESRDGQTCST